LTPVLVNTPHETAQMRAAACEALGEENVLERMPVKALGSEDFAWMLDQVPGCYFLLGNGTGTFNGCSPHNDHYDFNDDAIPLGAECWTRLVQNVLA